MFHNRRRGSADEIWNHSLFLAVHVTFIWIRRGVELANA